MFSELENTELLQWVNYELTGYPTSAKLPSYRIGYGNLVGSYFKGSMANHMIWKNVSIPLGKMPDDFQQALLGVNFYDGVGSLKKLLEKGDASDGKLCKTIPADYFPYIAQCNNDLYMNITSARVEIGAQCISDVFSSIENRLIEILLLLEKEFGILDELDLDVSNKTDEEINDINKRLSIIIYCDQRVQIGDGNKIKDANIASTINNTD